MTLQTRFLALRRRAAALKSGAEATIAVDVAGWSEWSRKRQRGVSAAYFFSISRPEAARTHSTQGLSSTMTSHVKTRSKTVIRRSHGSVRAA